MTVIQRLLVAVAALVSAAGASLTAVAASAAPVPESGEAGLLTLHADPYPAHDLEIARGEHLLWPVTAELDAPTTGSLDVRVVSAEPLAEDEAGLRFTLASCDEEWTLPAVEGDPATCAGGPGDVVVHDSAFATTDEGEVWSLGPIAPGIPRFFLVTLALPLSTPGALATESARISFGFSAQDVTEETRLAMTGAGYAGPALLGAGLLFGGLVVASARRAEVRGYRR